jgi:4-diphosphocytidyl-2-C-methyl-D-erythritol kinase
LTIRVTAPAKINLSLHVLGRRDDGFHEIRTVFQAVDLGDEVCVTRAGDGIELDVRGPDLWPVEKNLAYRAAELFREASGEAQGVHIRLTKKVPAGAGLGGGSSDAAAVLRAMAGRSLGPTRRTLMSLGARLGSDVPFFLGESPLARGLGRGEILEPLPPLPPADLVLALPSVHVSTAGAYASLSRPALPAGAAVPLRHDASAGAGAGSWTEVLGALHNDFQPVVSERHAEVRRSLDALREAGALAASLSGSGGACFGFFADRAAAVAAADALTLEVGWRFVAVRTLTRWPEPVVQSSASEVSGP